MDPIYQFLGKYIDLDKIILIDLLKSTPAAGIGVRIHCQLREEPINIYWHSHQHPGLDFETEYFKLILNWKQWKKHKLEIL